MKRSFGDDSMNNHIDLLYISNSPMIAKTCEEAGIDYLFIDLETNGKEERQHNMDTVKSHHSFDDISLVRPFLDKTKLLVRINPFYEGTKNEVDLAIEKGADSIMLPMFETAKEVKRFINYIGGRAEVFLLLETKKALENLNEILKCKGIDRIHIGLNDLHLQLNKSFMFELIADGTVETIIKTIKDKPAIKYGFGGVSKVGGGLLPAKNILAYHYYLNSSSVILSRNFCDLSVYSVQEASEILKVEVAKLRVFYASLENESPDYFVASNRETIKIINQISGKNYV